MVISHANVAGVLTLSKFNISFFTFLSFNGLQVHIRKAPPGAQARIQVCHISLAYLYPYNLNHYCRLSEASKMLRRLEKGLNTAKMKSQTSDSPYHMSDARNIPSQDPLYPSLRPGDNGFASPTTHFPSNELPPINLPTYQNGDNYPGSSNGSRSMDMEDDEDDDNRNDGAFVPEKLIRRENRRSFFRTILNPEDAPALSGSNRGNSFTPPQPSLALIPMGLNDPITAGIIDEERARELFDLFFLRLNPFINLFDPSLHSVPYVRSKCPFLFTTLIMAACKFFRHDAFKECQKLANEFAIRAFADGWKRVEVVQAFACLTYWKDPDDTVRANFIIHTHN